MATPPGLIPILPRSICCSGALPARAIILEGHTSSRNLEEAGFNWETEAREHRAWIRQQDAEYLRRTGLADVMTKHHAEYVNITEAYWDGACNQRQRSRSTCSNTPAAP